MEYPIDWKNNLYDVVFDILTKHCVELGCTLTWQLDPDWVSEIPTTVPRSQKYTLAEVKQRQIELVRQRDLLRQAIALTEGELPNAV